MLILAYHGVTDQRLAVPNVCQVKRDDFVQQVDWLSASYHVMPLDEVVERWRTGRPLPPNPACITFDDGFRNVATTAYPILEQRQMPATVFLVTGFVGTRQPAWPDRLYHGVSQTTRKVIRLEGAEYPLGSAEERARAYRALSARLKPMACTKREERLHELAEALGSYEVPAEHPVASMDWDEVEGLARSGLVRFGSHTHTHPILSRCSPERQRRELQRSRDVLRERGLSADLFAYPNGRAGDFTPETQGMLRELGYRCAVTMLPGLNEPGTNPLALRRVGVGDGSSLRQFAIQVATA